tara:strand:- start:785 stop:2053 length:1269 start_codon:yes stop_codon:yes gene_type:complete
MEKGLSNNFDNFGLTHEISFAYSFSPNLTEDRVMLEDDYEDDLVQNNLEPENIATNEEIEELKQKLAENDAIIEELMFRQDSLEATRQTDLERRFEMVMRMVRNETNGDRPDLENRAKELFMDDDARAVVASALKPRKTEDTSTLDILNNDKQQDRVAATDDIIDTKVNDLVQPKDAVVANRPRKVVKPVSKPEVVQDGVKSRKFKNLPNVTDGYYVVANVYKGGKYMDNFLTTLNNKGINADYIDNPNNGLKYVYLQRYETFEDAVAAHDSKLNGMYDGAMWIMNVENKYTNEAYASNVNKIKEKSSKYDSDLLTTNVVVKDNVGSNDADPKSYVIEGTGSGYYLIANVFANPNNAKKFVKLLNSFGLSASYFINPKNNYRYVYLKKHDSWTNALISYYSKLNDAYNDKMWIMRVNQEQMA